MKNKKNIIILSIALLIILGISGIIVFNKDSNIVITFNNNTNYNIENLKLNYTNSK